MRAVRLLRPSLKFPVRSYGTSLDIGIARVRRDTKGCDVGRIFLNSAGSSLPPRCVVDAHVAYLQEEEMCGGYEVAERREAELEALYPSAARLLGCKDSEVAFVESATRGWTLLMNSIRFAPGDRILTSASDYGSNFVGYLQARDRWGAEVVIVPDDQHGQVDLEKLREAAKHPRARLISINHVPTCAGLVQPAEEVGKIARDAQLLYLLDACQSVGQLDVDVDRLGCDMLTATGRKFLRGPRGTGLMYVRESCFPMLDPQSLDQEGARLVSETELRVRPGARCFEQYEYSFGGKLGLAMAIDYALDLGLHAIAARAQALAARLRQGLAGIAGVQVTDVGRELCAIVTFQVADQDATVVKEKLAARGIVSSISRAAGGAPLVWFTRRGLVATVRLSPHYFNTEAEVDRCIEVVRDVWGSRPHSA